MPRHDVRPLTDEEKEKCRNGSILNERPDLEFIAVLLLSQRMEEFVFKPRARKKVESAACTLQ